MDTLDYKILECLKHNARQKASAIGEKINLSVSAVIERIRKLENAGIISGYTVEVDMKKLGQDVTAFMEIGLEHPKYYDSFTQAIKNNPNIISCYYLTGDYDFLIKIVTDSSDSLEMLHRHLKSLDGVQSTRTHIVLKNIKNDYVMIPESEKQQAENAD
nr:Lrp/AsnC family transcriptional regulator [Clostridia bacterium]